MVPSSLKDKIFGPTTSPGTGPGREGRDLTVPGTSGRFPYSDHPCLVHRSTLTSEVSVPRTQLEVHSRVKHLLDCRQFAYCVWRVHPCTFEDGLYLRRGR